MTTKLISVCCAGILAVGGVFWLGNQPAAAWEPAANAQLTPIPEPTAASAPANPQPQQGVPPNSGLPGNGAAMAGTPSVLHPQAETAEGGDCAEDFCGLPVCSPPGRFWLRADYLIWWTNGVKLPPLVTTSPSGTAVEEAGVLGYANTNILFGNSTVFSEGRSGYQGTIGAWLDDCHTWGVEFDYFAIGDASDGFSQTSNGSTILARPFYNTETGKQASELVAYPDVVEGTVSANASESFWSAGVMMSYNICSCDSCSGCDSCADPCGPPLLNCCRADLLVGFRHYNLRDSLNVTEDLRDTSDEPTADTTYVIHDNFKASNHFYGSELGLRTKLYRGRWSLDVLTKIAIGNNHQTVTIDGTTAITAPDEATKNYNSGILAGSTNSGKYQADSLTLIPQLGLELGYQVNNNLRAYLGYRVLYWSAVARAADQVDLNLDPRNFPPPTAGGLAFPAYPGDVSSFWAQAINVGGELRF